MATVNKDFKVKHGLSVSGGATFGQAIEIGEPTADDHAASKGYVDTAISDKADLVNGTVSPDQLSTINEVLYAPRFVSIASNGTFAYSTDNTTWTQGSLPHSAWWTAGAFGNGKFVAIGVSSPPKAAYSSDGFNWISTPFVALPQYSFWGSESLAYGNGKFVAVGGDSSKANVGAFSTDGINWTQTTLPVSAWWRSITYGNGRFVAVANNSDQLGDAINVAAYSDDGINWTQTQLPSAQFWSSVAYGNGKFVAVSGLGSGSTVGAYSSDGITWQASTMISKYWSSVTFGDGKFVAIASNNSNPQTGMYSVDGITWTSMTYSSLGDGNNYTSVSYGESSDFETKQFFVTGATGAATNKGLKSFDGITWTSFDMPSTQNWKSEFYGEYEEVQDFPIASQKDLDSAITTHNSDTTNVHGIANTADLATKSYADTAAANAVAGLVDSAPGALDTLNELAAALGDDENFATTVTTALGTKAPIADPTFTGEVTVNSLKSPDGTTVFDSDFAGDDLKRINVDLVAVGFGTGQTRINEDTVESSNVETDVIRARYDSPPNVYLGDDSTPDNLLASKGYVDTSLDGKLSLAGGTLTGALTLNADPSADMQAATKGYVDSIAGSNNAIAPVLAATTTNINISTDTLVGDVIDGVTLQADTRILIKNQTVESQNGIYVVNASGPATRAPDYNSNEKVAGGDHVYVISGDRNLETFWVLTTYDVNVNIAPLIFIFLGPIKTPGGSGISIDYDELVVDTSIIATLVSEGTELDSAVTASSLTSLGVLDSLSVVGDSDVFSLTVEEDLGVTGDTSLNTLSVSGEAVFNDATFNGSVGTLDISTAITVPAPTQPTHAATKNYVDSLLNQASVEITTIDDLSNYFNGYNSRFLPTYKGLPVTLQNPFNLLLTIDGIIQSVGSPDYVWQSVMPRVGFRIDNDGYIAFPEAIPVGSSFDARVLVGSATTTQTKVYPFKAMDIVLGGY